MKKLVASIKIIGFILLSISFAHGQNVGINTLTPDATFHVFSGGQILMPGGLTLLGNRNENHLELDFNRVQSSFGIEGTPIKFFIQPQGGFTEVGDRMAVGTNTFNGMLNVAGGVNISDNAYGDLVLGDPEALHLRMDGNELLAKNNDEPSTLYLQYWSGNVSMANDADGQVGIGTSSPEAKLHIKGGADVDLSDGGHILLGNKSSTNLAMDNNEIMVRNNGGTGTMYLQGNGGDILMVPNEAGAVGIGITSANFLPDGYLFAVDGKIISEEIRVEMSGDWPDYVFEPDYKLTSLEDLESQIEEKGHLPGIPSAKKVEREGFELGDMQKRMMEKIEELTLYMIEANKQIKSLEEKVKSLEESK